MKNPHDNYIVEIWRKSNQYTPIIQYNLSLKEAERLYCSAAFNWKVRRIIDGNNNGLIIKEENK